MKTFPLTGLVAATHTPFTHDGHLNLAIIEHQAHHLLKQHVEWVFIGGTTGESHSLTLREREQLAHRWVDVTRGTPLQVIVHVGANSLQDTRTLAAQAQQLGTAAISSIPPCYFRPRTISSLVECCAATAAAAPDLPYFYYDIPSMTGVALPMADFLTQAAESIPNLAGLKFSNLDLPMFQHCLRAAGGQCSVAWGTDECLLAALALGGTSAVGSTYNFCAPLYHRMIRAFAAGDWESARREQFRSAQLVSLLASHGYMAAAKTTMSLLGVEVGPPRLPHTPLTAEARTRLTSDLESLGFFDWAK